MCIYFEVPRPSSSDSPPEPSPHQDAVGVNGQVSPAGVDNYPGKPTANKEFDWKALEDALAKLHAELFRTDSPEDDGG